jgi:hypothetical protein
MGGFMGIGHSSQKTDRAAQLSAQQGLWDVGGWSTPLGRKTTEKGLGTLDTSLNTLDKVKDYWSKLMTAGRTETAQRAAPAIQAATAQGDATRRQESAMGTGRSGGTASANREAGTATAKTVDDIIAGALFGGQAQAATGLTGVAGGEAGIAGEQLGAGAGLRAAGAGAYKDIMQNATESRPISQQINRQAQADVGQAIGAMMMGFGF